MADTEELVEDTKTEDTTASEAVEAAPEAESGKATSILSDDTDKEAVAPADWPEDWRAKLAGDDEKLAKRLERMKSPGDVLKAWQNADKLINSGKVKQELAEDATEEDIAAYRKDNGIPETPEGYRDLMKGVVPGEGDEDNLNSFFAAMHKDNVRPDHVNATLNWYYGRQEAALAEVTKADMDDKTGAEDALRAEWGGEYRSNINGLKNYLSGLGETDDGVPLGEALSDARLSNGKLFFNDPSAVKWLSGLVDEMNPAGFVAPGNGTSQVESIEKEISEIESKMGTKEYIKDDKMQARLRDLYTAQEKLSSRAA